MLLAPSVAGLFKCRQFGPEMILLAVGWYLRFSLSYRDVEELLARRPTELTAPGNYLRFRQGEKRPQQRRKALSIWQRFGTK
jgi:hypothetical protein